MSDMQIFFELGQNIAVLMMMTFVVSYIFNSFHKPLKLAEQLSLGLCFGFIAIIGMIMSVKVKSGIILDGRMIVIAISGFFGGGVVALIAGLLASVYRVLIGGVGMPAGVGEIVVAMIVGTIFNIYCKDKKKLKIHLFSLGLLTTACLLIISLIFIRKTTISLFSPFAFVGIFFYPLGTLAVGMLFALEGGRRESLGELSDSREKYSEMLENLHEGFFNMLVDGTFLDHNRTFNRILGIDEDEDLRGRKSSEFWVNPAGRARYIEKLLKDGKVSNYDVEVKKKDGSIAIAKINTRLIKDDKGVPVRIEGTTLDITDQRKTEQSLAESEEYLKTAYRAADNVSFISTDLSGRNTIILDFSPGAEKIFGYKAEEVLNKHVSILHPPEFLEDFPSILDNVSKGENHTSTETILVRKSGEQFPAMFTIYPRRDLEGKVIGTLGVSMDLSAEKEMELKLRHSEKMESIGQLAGGVAHDFNNMLGVIKGYADILVRSLDDEEFVDCAKCINKAADRSAVLTNQLLAFARKGQYQQSVIDIHQIISETISMLEHSVDKKIELHQILKANPSTIKGDSSQILNSFLNLAINASDAMPDGGRLTFSTDVIELDSDYCQQHLGELLPGEYLEITVTDTGIGMTEEVRPHIFEPFYTTKPKGKGTGMGLAAVYGIIKNHNGDITVKSNSAKGSSFTIHLPISIDHEVGEQLQIQQITSKDKLTNVLVIDDEKLVCKLLGKMLKKLGYQRKICESGKEAVAYYRDSWKDVDVVLLDMVMPGMDGKETFIELKKINPAVKAILATGYSLDADSQKVLDEGVLGFIQKPFSLNSLDDAICEVLATPK